MLDALEGRAEESNTSGSSRSFVSRSRSPLPVSASDASRRLGFAARCAGQITCRARDRQLASVLPNRSEGGFSSVMVMVRERVGSEAWPLHPGCVHHNNDVLLLTKRLGGIGRARLEQVLAQRLETGLQLDSAALKRFFNSRTRQLAAAHDATGVTADPIHGSKGILSGGIISRLEFPYKSESVSVKLTVRSQASDLRTPGISGESIGGGAFRDWGVSRSVYMLHGWSEARWWALERSRPTRSNMYAPPLVSFAGLLPTR